MVFKLNPEVRDWIIIALFPDKKLNRKQLVEMTKFPRTTVYDHLDRLRGSNHTKKTRAKRTTRGRPHELWSLTDKGRNLLLLREGEIDE